MLGHSKPASYPPVPEAERRGGKPGRGQTYSELHTTCQAWDFPALGKGYVFFTGANGIENGIHAGVFGRIFSGGLMMPLNIVVGLVVACTMYGLYTLFRKGDM